MYNCKICNTEFNTIKELSNHIKYKEHLKVKDYYDTYIKQENEGICPCCGKPTKFNCLEYGYKHHCSYKCSNSDKEVQAKQQATTIKHYGVPHPAQSKQIIDKMHKTCIDLYGASNGHGEIQKEQMRQNNLTNYGVEYSWQREDVKNKIKQTNLANHGTTHWTNRKKLLKLLKRMVCIEQSLKIDI